MNIQGVICLQAPKQGIKRSLTETEVATLIRRHQLQHQQKVIAGTQGAAGSPQVQFSIFDTKVLVSGIDLVLASSIGIVR